MEAFEVILDILNELIVDKAFNKKNNIKKRLPYILIYYIVIISLCTFILFLAINLIKLKNIIGYLFIIMFIILLTLLILPFINPK